MKTAHKLVAAGAAYCVLALLAASAANSVAESPRFAALVAEARDGVRTISVPGLRARLEAGDRGFVLIDVREDSEWETDRLPGAIHIGRGVLEARIERAVPDVKTEIVLYCAGGARSTLAAASLGRMGYERVYSLEGGVREWFASSPLARSSPAGK